MYVFKSIQQHFERGKGGSMNEVVIQNGKGHKAHATIDKNGKLIRQSRHTLKRGEVKAIRNKKFVPKLWKCCAARKTTRKQRRA